MPIIFAQAIMFLPTTLIQLSGSESLSGVAAALGDFTGFWYNVIFFLMIIKQNLSASNVSDGVHGWLCAQEHICTQVTFRCGTSSFGKYNPNKVQCIWIVQLREFLIDFKYGLILSNLLVLYFLHFISLFIKFVYIPSEVF